MEQQNKICQNCEKEFTIEPEDFAFYQKIAVPPPTFCPECRLQRRLAFRNERVLFKRQCDLCKKDIIAMYPEKLSFPVYCLNCFNSDKWDPLDYSITFDSKVPFLEQFRQLQKSIPRPQNISYRLVNSDYTNCSGDLKNCYLIFGCLKDENCYYSHYINDSKDCMDVLYCLNSEWCYNCFDIENCYKISFSQSCLQCRDSMFLFDCRNCADCIGCVGLRNRSYHIFNKPYSKEEYLKKKTELKLDTRDGILEFHNRYLSEIYFKIPRKFYHGKMNREFSGDYVSNSEKTFNSFYTKNARNVKFSFWNVNAKDVYDYFAWGDAELCYETVSTGENAYNCRITTNCWSSSNNLEYSDLCFSSSNLFGCIGLKHKQYCILNKRYSEKEYKEMRQEIIRQMNEKPYIDSRKKVYGYGEFFPIELSPFDYNHTVAQEHFPLIKEEAIEKGCKWKDPEPRNYQITMKTEEIPDHIKDVKDSITQEIIQCCHTELQLGNAVSKCNEQCTTAFKIIPQELQFYRRMNLPLPRLCPNCRHYERIKQRNPLKLWNEKCQCGGVSSDNGVYQNTIEHPHHNKEHCPNEFETSYSPERPEIVYCEKCYLSEVA